MAPAPKFSAEEQEHLVLSSAAKCIEASSMLDFTMAAISKEAGLSMGTIYKHIQSKEDVLVALGYQSQLHFKAMVLQVFQLPLPVVAKIVGVQLVDTQRVSPYSFWPQLDTLLANPVILQRASRTWVEKFIQLDTEVESVFQHQIQHACETGELKLPKADWEPTVNEILTSVWSICVGHTQVTMQRGARQILEGELTIPTCRAPDSTIIHSVQRLMNTYPWKPKLTESLIAKTCTLLEESGLR